MSAPTIEVTLDVKLLEVAYLLTSALEGGIAYWAAVEGKTPPTKLEHTMDILTGDKNPKVYPHVDYLLNPGGAVRIRDYEQDKVHKLDFDALARGLRVMAEKYPRHFGDFMGDNADSTTADVFIQCAIFGEIIYG